MFFFFFFNLKLKCFFSFHTLIWSLKRQRKASIIDWHWLHPIKRYVPASFTVPANQKQVPDGMGVVLGRELLLGACAAAGRTWAERLSARWGQQQQQQQARHDEASRNTGLGRSLHSWGETCRVKFFGGDVEAFPHHVRLVFVSAFWDDSQTDEPARYGRSLTETTDWPWEAQPTCTDTWSTRLNCHKVSICYAYWQTVVDNRSWVVGRVFYFCWCLSTCTSLKGFDQITSSIYRITRWGGSFHACRKPWKLNTPAQIQKS